MADPNDILSNLLTQPPYVREANTEDFLENLHRANVTDEKAFRDKFNKAVRSNLGFNVSISKSITTDNLEKYPEK